MNTIEIYILKKTFLKDAYQDSEFSKKDGRPYYCTITSYDNSTYLIPITHKKKKFSFELIKPEDSIDGVGSYLHFMKCFVLEDKRIIDSKYSSSRDGKMLISSIIAQEESINKAFYNYLLKHHPTAMSVNQEYISSLQK